MNASTAWHQVKAYILNPAHALNVFYVLLGGYAVAGFVWEFSHRGELAGYVLENHLPSGEYPSLPMLAVTAILAGSLWLVLSIFLARLTGRQLDAVLSRLSGVFLSATLLVFLPVLSLPGIETDQQLLTLALIATMGAIAAVAVVTIQQGSARSTEHTVPGATGSTGQATGWPTHTLLGSAARWLIVLVLGYIV